MEQKRGDAERPNRVIMKIEVTYRLRDDESGKVQKFTLEHEGDGEAIDGLVWNRALVEKLAYREGSGYRDAERRSGAGRGWKTDMQKASENCLWFHEDTCVWFETCGPII